jgi:hypothetical protein
LIFSVEIKSTVHIIDCLIFKNFISSKYGSFLRKFNGEVFMLNFAILYDNKASNGFCLIINGQRGNFENTLYYKNTALQGTLLIVPKDF